MTDELSFQRTLDADPSLWRVRLTFADWLEERGDPRAAGMRWLGMKRKWPVFLEHEWWETFIGWNWAQAKNPDQPDHAKIPATEKELVELDLWRAFKTRADAENAFCLAYPALLAEHPAEFAVDLMELVT